VYFILGDVCPPNRTACGWAGVQFRPNLYQSSPN
jgi:hypothetical protein